MRFSFQEAQKHSKQRAEVQILDKYWVTIRPIAPAQADHIAPMIKRIFKKLKEIHRQSGSDAITLNEMNILDSVIDAACHPETRDDAINLIISVLDRPDFKMIEKDSTGKVIASFDEMFTFDDFKTNGELTDMIVLLKAIWKQNAQKIFDSVAKTDKAGKEESKENQQEEKTDQKKIVPSPSAK